jgi:hypothetical protein
VTRVGAGHRPTVRSRAPAGPAECGQLEQLRVVAGLGAGAVRVPAVGAGSAGHRQAGEAGDLGRAEVGPAGEGVSGREQRDLALRAEFFGVGEVPW